MRDGKGRFRPGVSGNPNGRPPRGESLADILWAELKKPHGDATKAHAIIERLVDMALDDRKDLRAMKIITGLMLETDKLLELEELKRDIDAIKEYFAEVA